MTNDKGSKRDSLTPSFNLMHVNGKICKLVGFSQRIKKTGETCKRREAHRLLGRFKEVVSERDLETADGMRTREIIIRSPKQHRCISRAKAALKSKKLSPSPKKINVSIEYKNQKNIRPQKHVAKTL